MTARADVYIVQNYPGVGTGGGKRVFEKLPEELLSKVTVEVGGAEDIPSGAKAIVFAMLSPAARACGLRYARRIADERPGLPVILLGSNHTIEQCGRYSAIPEGVTPIFGCVKNDSTVAESVGRLARLLLDRLTVSV